MARRYLRYEDGILFGYAGPSNVYIPSKTHKSRAQGLRIGPVSRYQVPSTRYLAHHPKANYRSAADTICPSGQEPFFPIFGVWPRPSPETATFSDINNKPVSDERPVVHEILTTPFSDPILNLSLPVRLRNMLRNPLSARSRPPFLSPCPCLPQ